MELTVTSPTSLTPWEFRGGMWYKREDYHRNHWGVNGSKYRASRHLIVRAVVEQGIDHIVSASSVRSPQAAVFATLAAELGLKCTVVVGASKPETAARHPYISLALAAGAKLDTSTKVAYNTALQRAGQTIAERLGAWKAPYPLVPAVDEPGGALRAFLEVGASQAGNLPPSIRTLVVPFGTGQTASGVLYGLSKLEPGNLERVILVGIGPDKSKQLWERLAAVDVFHTKFDIELVSTFPWFAEYDDEMPETIDGIVMHPTYEGKVVRFLNLAKPKWWTARDGSTGFWIVGGPLPKVVGTEIGDLG